MLKTVQDNTTPDDDSTCTMHNTSAILGLSDTNTSEEIPETLITTTEIRQIVSTNDVVEAFIEFGDAASAAVPHTSCVFGLVRPTSTKSVQRTME